MPTRRNQCRTESYRTFHLAHFVNFPNEPRSHADRRLSQARPCEVARCGSAGRPEWNGRRDPSGGSRSVRTIVRWGSATGTASRLEVGSGPRSRKAAMSAVELRGPVTRPAFLDTPGSRGHRPPALRVDETPAPRDSCWAGELTADSRSQP